MRKIALIIAAALCMALGLTLAAEDFGGRARIDRTVHDFGNVSLKDGPLSASFTVTNISNVIAEFCVNSIAPDKFDLACSLIQDGVRDLKLSIDRNRGAVLDALLKAEFDKTNDRSM